MLDLGPGETAGTAGAFGALLGMVVREFLNRVFKKNGNAGDQSKEYWVLAIGEVVENKLEGIHERLQRIENTMERRSHLRD